MIGHSDTAPMMALLQRRHPRASTLAAVHFTSSVGVAPGTTTLDLRAPMVYGPGPCGPDTPGSLRGPGCPPDPMNQYMVTQAGAKRAVATAMRQAQYEVYGNETSMNGLGVAELGPSWSRVLLVALGAALLGAGAAVLVSRSKA